MLKTPLFPLPRVKNLQWKVKLWATSCRSEEAVKAVWVMFWLNRARAKRRLKQTVEEQLAAHAGGPPLQLRRSPDHLQALPVWLRTVAPSPSSDVSDWVGGMEEEEPGQISRTQKCGYHLYPGSGCCQVFSKDRLSDQLTTHLSSYQNCPFCSPFSELCYSLLQTAYGEPQTRLRATLFASRPQFW